MTFDIGELPGRREGLHAAYRRARSKWEDMHGPETAGYDPEWDLEDGDFSDLYTEFSDIPSPDDFGYHVGLLLDGMTILTPDGFTEKSGGETTTVPPNTVHNNVGTSGIEIEDWTGDAAAAYQENYASNFDDMVQFQFAVYWACRQSLNAEAAVWQEVRKDLDEISQNAIEQMDAVTESGKDDWEAALKVAGAVAAVAGAVPTGSASVAAWSVFGAGVTVASTGMDLAGAPESVDPMGLPNGTPKAIVQSVRDYISQVKTWIITQEDKIVVDLQASLDAIAGAPDTFCLPMPALGTVPRENVHDEENAGGV